MTHVEKLKLLRIPQKGKNDRERTVFLGGGQGPAGVGEVTNRREETLALSVRQKDDSDCFLLHLMPNRLYQGLLYSALEPTPQ